MKLLNQIGAAVISLRYDEAALYLVAATFTYVSCIYRAANRYEASTVSKEEWATLTRHQVRPKGHLRCHPSSAREVSGTPAPEDIKLADDIPMLQWHSTHEASRSP